ncbi:uncharacterized protein BDV17DRAFT_292636 [Aspergillus undulatus]|uniref:uncharacterized protein n=1 Tax=Aspergillus undulatus TaxID=1810928 RepID=UPI003CCD58D9
MSRSMILPSGDPTTQTETTSTSTLTSTSASIPLPTFSKYLKTEPATTTTTMTSPAVTPAPGAGHPTVMAPTYSQKDIYTALVTSGTQTPKSLDISYLAAQKEKAMRPSYQSEYYPPPPPPSPVQMSSGGRQAF